LKRKGKRVERVSVVRDITESVKHEEKLRALHQHALLLSSTNNMDEILNVTLNAMEYALGFDVADIYLAEGDSVNVKRTKGLPMGLSAENVNGRGLVAKAARSQATVRASDTRKEADYVDRKGLDWTGPPTMLSEIAVPIVVDGKTAGVLNVENTRLDAFTDNDQMLLETLAAHFAIQMQRLKHVQELRRSSQFLKTIIENANVWINVLDNENNVIVWNKAAEIISGFPREEVLGHKKIWSWLYPEGEYRKQITDSVVDVLQHGRVEQDVETNIRRKDGETKIISWNERNLLDEHGKAIGSVAIGRDITERKRMEEELRRYSTSLEELVAERTGELAESERRFRELADLLPQIVFEMDDKGNLTFLNHIGFAWTGYGEDDLHRGLSAFQMFIPEEHDRARLKMRKLLSGEKFGSDEYTVLRKDGSTFPASVYAAPVMREDRAVGVRGVVVDITERKRMEEALRVSEERFRGIAERSIDGIFEMDLEGRLTYVSPSAEPALGYKPEEIMGTRMEQYLPESEIPKITPNLAALMEGKNVIGLQGEMLRKDGTHVSAELNASPIFKDGKIVGVQGIVRDITERVKMEKALRESESRFRELAELLPQIVFETDENGVFTFVNHVGLVSTGYTEDDLLKGANLYQLVPPEEYGKVSESLARRHEREPISLELKVLRKDNSAFPALVYAGAIVRERKVVGFRGIVLDITERKQMEEALLKTEKLAAIGETAAMVAHDLRNPLQGIAGATYLLKQESLTAREKTELLQLVEENIEYSDAIVRDLLDYSGEIHLKLVETTPKSITSQAIQAIKVPEKIAVEDSSEDHITLRADPDRMKRVFINLIENAIDAMPQGGALTISSKQSDESVEIAISDTGTGMPEKVVQNLWKPLQTTKAKGLGLGLAICKRIVDAHGGTISLESRIGEGTTVTVRLPIRPNAMEVKQK
jgi:PAS domain S-box-containing protein